MHDYIGGRSIPTGLDSQGRCIHQLERTVFLPQPNTSLLFLGRGIDVTKIELITYGADVQKLIWRTLLSDNKSANLRRRNGYVPKTQRAYQDSPGSSIRISPVRLCSTGFG